MANQFKAAMPQLLLLCTSLVLVLLPATLAQDYTCDVYGDSKSGCSDLRMNGVCDDPEFGGGGGDACRGFDCIDCNVECNKFNADCYGCINAKGCYYCPEDGTCDNFDGYTSSNKVKQCTKSSDYLDDNDGTEACIASNAFHKDPLYTGSKWMFDMINVVDVWEEYGLTGKGITVRINDDGVYVDNKEFKNRFDNVGNSCTSYKPTDEDGHGTAVAGIIMGNADNDLCGVGIASDAKFSSCNFFTDDAPDYSSLAYKLETFEISQNSIGMPACDTENPIETQDNILFDTECPFQADSDWDPCEACKGEFVESRSVSNNCGSAILTHCKYHYKEDIEACTDFPEVIIGGDCDYDKLPKAAFQALESGIASGRGGKGTIFTFASGNSFKKGDDVNFSGWTNTRYTISVGAVGKDGFHADYSTSGAALMVSAPSGDDKDIGHLMTAGLGVEQCADSGQGTSFACPVVSGVIALMLDANSDLSWRDVQGIIATTSTTVPQDDEDETQTTNAAGIWHSNWYGFGIINALGAVEAALDWDLYTEELQAIGMSKEENKELADSDGNQFTSTIELDPSDDNFPEDFVAESTTVLIDLSHYNRGDLEIELESPGKTISILHPGKRPENSQLKEDERWKLMTLKNWGEDATGKWKLRIRDLVDREDSADKNVFRNWQLIVYGRSESGESVSQDSIEVSDEDKEKSAFCLNPQYYPCNLSNDGNQACSAQTQVTFSEKLYTIDAEIICPNDVLLEKNLDYEEASQRGLCGCEASLADEDCDIIEEDLECQCFICPEGATSGVAYSCNKEIVANCKSFDCDAQCNGDYLPPLLNADFTPQPTRNPTKFPTASPTKTPTESPTEGPTKVKDEDKEKSAYCLNPQYYPCNLSKDGNQACPAQTQITFSEKLYTIDAEITCPNDVLLEKNLDYEEASQRGLCSCEASLADEDCDIIEEDLECQCFMCPEDATAGVAYSCNKEIVANCKSFDCDAQCNGDYLPPLLNADFTPQPTKSPTRNPTKSPTKPEVSDEDKEKSEFCLNPQYYPCNLSKDGNQACPAQTQITFSEKLYTIDAEIICPNDVLLEKNLDYEEASQRGLCGCEASLADEDCDIIEEDLECQCFMCPEDATAGVAFSCNKEIVANCKSFDCDAQCNGDYLPPLLNADFTPQPTKSPTRNPTKSPTKPPVINGTPEPTRAPTRSPTNNPTESREPSEMPATQISDEDLININRSDESEEESEVPSSSPTITEIKEEGNVSCQTGIPIRPETTPIQGTIRSLPLVGMEGSCLSGLETIAGWYQVIGNGNIYTLTACSLVPSKSVGISVFTGSCTNSRCIEHQSRQIAACENGNGHQASFASKPDEVYEILVSGIPVGAPLPILMEKSEGASSTELRFLQSEEDKPEEDFMLTFTENEEPPNSKCGSALPFTNGKPVKGNTLGELTEWRTCYGNEKSGAWYNVMGGTPNEDEGVIVYEANTCNPESNFYNTISVFKADSCADVSAGAISEHCVNVDVLPCPSGWFGQQVFWSSSTQENYKLFVHSSDTEEALIYDAGDFAMDVAMYDRLVNDQCNAAFRVELTVDESVKSTTSGAKPDMDAIERSSCKLGAIGAWYKAKGTGGMLQASTCSGETDHKTAIHVYSGECGFLQCIDTSAGTKALCPDGKGSVVNFQTQEGVEYFILVSGRREGKTGTFRLQVTEEDAEENNSCVQAVALTKKDPSATGSTLQATIDFPPDESCAVPLDTPGVWYTVEGEGKAIEVSTCQDNEFDAAISVFEGSCPNLLECVAGSFAEDPKCTDGKGVTTSFYGELKKQYHIYVHGRSGSSNNLGDFTLSYDDFDVLTPNEFCPNAREIPTDGTRVQGSTEDATRANTPVSSCGVDITNPGLWYTFQGNGQSFEILACAEDEGDFEVSVSIFEGGPGGCDSLTCLTGTTFVESCSTAKERRFLQGISPSNFRLMTAPKQDYYVFVHGTDVGDFALYVRDEMVDGFGTPSPTITPLRHGVDLFRWMPYDTESIIINTDYFELEMVDEPTQGNVTLNGYMLQYDFLGNFTGDDVMTVDGCNNDYCERFDVTIHIVGERADLLSAEDEGGWNKLWLLLLLLLLLIPLICLPFYLFYKNKNKDDELSRDDFDDEDDYDADEKGLLPNQQNSRRGMNDSSDEDWGSSEDDDGSYDSQERESTSGNDDDSSEEDSTDNSNDGFADGFGDDDGSFSEDEKQRKVASLVRQFD